MSADKLAKVRNIAGKILKFIPAGEREHYRCPNSFHAGRIEQAPPELRPELTRFFRGQQDPDGTVIRFETLRKGTPGSYAVIPETGMIRLQASGPDSFRQALYELEAQIVSGKLHPVHSKDVIADRIGRILCGPINRPPLYQDELSEDFDYYPEAYLNELARSGVNGVWISSDFRKLTGPGHEKRLERLRRTVEKCAPFGIRVFIFCIEPIAYEPDDPILKKHPELAGPSAMKKIAFCPSSKRAQDMLTDTARLLFREVPGLGGILDLTVGEWLTLCCNVPHSTGIKCPHCGDKPAWEVLNRSIDAMVKGMKEENPDALFVSWPYTQTGWWSVPEALEAASHPLPGVALTHNFESGGGMVQLGKYRKIKDYWLSYVGPSEFYREAAQRQRAAGGKMFAKLQVSCSTEIATTGYLPVPGLLYRKYKELHRLGISGVVMGWYFGCYPSLMTRAALKLSRTPFPRSESAFLKELAAERWGEKRAPEVASIWKRFSDAFAGYPLSNQLAYTGPMHDSISWDLHLIPVNTRLAASWNIHAGIPGDRIFDCLNGFKLEEPFSLDDMILLAKKMADRWQAAAADLSALDDGTLDDAQKLEIGVAQAVGLIFEDAADIFRFYRCREELIFRDPSLRLLDRMRKIVECAIARSRQFLQLMEQNPFLGYHSEACGYKFTPQSVRQRIRTLERRLKTDFPRTAERIRAGKPLFGALAAGPRLKPDVAYPLAVCGEHRLEYAGAYPSDVYEDIPDMKAEAAVKLIPDGAGWRMILTAEQSRPDEFYRIWWEPAAGRKTEEVHLNADGSIRFTTLLREPETSREKRGKGYALTLRLPGREVNPGRAFVRFNIERSFTENGKTVGQYLVRPHYLPWVYTLGTRDSRDSAWLMTENDANSNYNIRKKPKGKRK